MRAYVSLLLLFISAAGYTQGGSLKFKQVRLVGSTVATVPAGHVWKVESAFSSKRSDLNNYEMEVNGQDVFLGEFLNGSNFIAGVTQIQIQVRGITSCPSGQNNGNLIFTYGGFEGELAFSGRSSSYTFTNPSTSSWTTLGTITPSYGQFELTSFSMTTGLTYRAFEIKMILTYVDGNTEEAVYNNGISGCANYSGTGTLVSQTVSSRARERYYLPTKLPVWLPEGATLRAGNNVGSLSVIEFEIVP